MKLDKCETLPKSGIVMLSYTDSAQMTLARWLSIVLHPFVMIGVMVGSAAAARRTAGEAVRSVAIVALFTIVPLAVLMWRQVRRGRWENADASNRAERPILYCRAAGLSAASPAVVRGPRGRRMLGMLAVCGIAPRSIKSHIMAFAALAAIALVLMRAPMGYALLLALPALVWSRLVLHRHTPIEVAFGAVIGAVTAAAIHFL